MYLISKARSGVTAANREGTASACGAKTTEWAAADESQRIECPQMFLAALQTFTAFVVDGRVPDNYR